MPLCRFVGRSRFAPSERTAIFLTYELGSLDFDWVQLAHGFKVGHPIRLDPGDYIVRSDEIQKMNRTFQIQILND